MKGIRCCHRWNIFVEVLATELLRRHGDSGFQECTITKRRITALVLNRNGMKYQNIVNREEMRRGGHLASLRISSPCLLNTSRTCRSSRASHFPVRYVRVGKECTPKETASFSPLRLRVDAGTLVSR